MEEHTGYDPEYLKTTMELKCLPIKFMFLTSTHIHVMYT